MRLREQQGMLKTSVIPVGMALLLLVGGCGGKKKGLELGSGNFPDVDGSEFARSDVQYDENGNPITTDGNWPNELPGEISLRPPVTMDGETGSLREVSYGEELPEGSPIGDLGVVYFGFDSDSLTDVAKETLTTNAQWLNSNQVWMVILRGHTDEKGTEEYNLSLGSRRAQAVREFLVGLGVEANRISTVSYGKSLPAVDTEEESALAKNRRVEFLVYTKE